MQIFINFIIQRIKSLFLFGCTFYIQQKQVMTERDEEQKQQKWKRNSVFNSKFKSKGLEPNFTNSYPLTYLTVPKTIYEEKSSHHSKNVIEKNSQFKQQNFIQDLRNPLSALEANNSDELLKSRDQQSSSQKFIPEFKLYRKFEDNNQQQHIRRKRASTIETHQVIYISRNNENPQRIIYKSNILDTRAKAQQNIEDYRSLLKSYYSIYTKINYAYTFHPDLAKPDLIAPSFFKAFRMDFKKKEQNMSLSAFIPSEKNFFMCKILQNLETITLFDFYKIKPEDVKQPTLQIEIPFGESYSSSIQVDYLNSRIICFSNKTQQIIIYSIKTKQIVCTVPIKYPRFNPLLFIQRLKQCTVLLVIGGYQYIRDGKAVNGSKYIEVFTIDRWSIGIKQKILKLRVGTICPIVIPVSDMLQKQVILLLGGNTTGDFQTSFSDKIKQWFTKPNPQILAHPKKQLDFKKYSDINSSFNQNTTIITLKKLDEIIYNEQQTIFQLKDYLRNRVSHQQDFNLLWGGIHLSWQASLKQNIYVTLPKQPYLYRIKVVNKELQVIKSRHSYFKISSKTHYYNLQLKVIKRQNNQIDLYLIDNNGKLNLLKQRATIQDFQLGGLSYP